VSKKYLAKHVAGLKPSGIRKFFDIVATMDDVISLGIGEPDFVTPKPILDAGIQALKLGKTHYTSNAGIFEFREALSGHLENLYGISYDPGDEIVVTVGVSEALYLALTAILNPGESVIIHTPCFVSYEAEIILAGGVPIELPCQVEAEFQLSPEALDAAITSKTKAILLSYPNNPTGAVASRETLLEIARIAEKHDLVVISDEIYDQLVYGVDHVCFASLPGMKDRTIIKNGAEQVDAMRREYNRRRELIVPGLNQLGLPTFEPRGAFYAFPQVSVSGMDDETFAERLLDEEKVAVVPGSAFGAAGQGFVRCSYATAYEKIEEALERMARFVQRHG
jgi:aminotransferase